METGTVMEPSLTLARQMKPTDAVVLTPLEPLKLTSRLGSPPVQFTVSGEDREMVLLVGKLVHVSGGGTVRLNLNAPTSLPPAPLSTE